MIYKLNSDVSINNCVSDVISDYQPSLFKYENRKSTKELRVLSLFSGCGGMDIGFEGGFICHRKSVNQEKDWIEHEINNDWVRLRKNRFKTIFANDILKEALLSWENYMSRYNIGSDTFYFQSIVELVKLHKIGAFSFPEDVDVVTGGFPCQDFSVAGKRGSSRISGAWIFRKVLNLQHENCRCNMDVPSRWLERTVRDSPVRTN